MRNRWKQVLVAGSAGALLAGLFWASGRVEAQDARARQAQDAAGQAGAGAAEADQPLILIYPTGDRNTSSLLVEAVTPAEVPVGQSYEYQIRVTNLTSNLILEDVRIEQTRAEGVSIESARVQGREGQARAKASGEARKKADAKKQAAAKKQAGEAKKQDRRKGQGAGQAGGPWTIDRLNPGESRTIRVTAIGDQEGEARTCIKVTYEPTLCIMTRFVQPELAVSKSAPEEADICRPLELRYKVANPGTGVARGVTLRDELPEGLRTKEGQNVVEFDVGDLAAGEERELSTTVTAADTGSYGSRAVAKSQDTEARSNRTETQIIAPALALELEGPNVQYVNQPVTYRATVRNTGDSPAVDTQLRINVADQARVLRMSRSEPGDVEPQRAEGTLSWALGTIEPGQERTVSFTTAGRVEGEMEQEAIATAVCAGDRERAEALTVNQAITTNILTLPALVLEMVDEHDPVKVGEETSYAIVVRNQGSGPDNNVQITCELPENFEFLQAVGTTEVKADGNTLTFAPIETLEPNEKAEWTVRVRAKSAGDVRTRVELKSDYLDPPVPELEPTRVIE